jgi:5-methylcytosine-specific restriction endonuclease McrA
VLMQCYDCKKVKPKKATSPRGKPLCAACNQKRRIAREPNFRLSRVLATHNSRSSTGRVELSDIYELQIKQVFKCAYCSEQIHYKFTLDHLVPTVAGGKHVPENIVLCCNRCNTSKQHKPLLTWLKSEGKILTPFVKERLECQKTQIRQVT